MSIYSSMPGDDHRLIITIVKKGVASRVVSATKEAKIGGGTVFLGRGTANKKMYMQIFGIDYEPEKEIIFTLVEQEKLNAALEVIVKETKLDQPGKGIAFVIRVRQIIGQIHMLNSQKTDGGLVMNASLKDCPVKFDLIVTIVNDGFAEDVIEAAKGAGAEGGTIIHGRGSGIHENAKLFGMTIQPEKEIVLTLVDTNKTRQILEAINEAVHLDKPNTGIAFVLNVEKAFGIYHLTK
jgi:nitrogen regulatory protein PII